MADRDHIHLYITSTVNSWITHASTTNRWCLWAGYQCSCGQATSKSTECTTENVIATSVVLQQTTPSTASSPQPAAWTFGSKCDTKLELCSGCAKTESHNIYFQDVAPWIRLIHHFDQSHCWITANARHPKWGACGLHDFLRSRHVPISGREPSVKQHVPKTSKKKKSHGCTHIVYIFTLSHITKPHSSTVGTGSPNGTTHFLISFWQDPLGAQIALVADTNNPHLVPLRLAEAPGDGELNMKFLREKFAEFRAFRSPINQDVNCLLEVAVCRWNLRAPSCA